MLTDLGNLYTEFKVLVSSLYENDLKDFICITAIQDKLVFCQFMIDLIPDLPERKLEPPEIFLDSRITEYNSQLELHSNQLPFNEVRKYISKDRLTYKMDLYFNSQISKENFLLVNEIYDHHLNSLPNASKKLFVDTLMYQDLYLICKSFIKDEVIY